jgi:hypothetical protein
VCQVSNLKTEKRARCCATDHATDRITDFAMDHATDFATDHATDCTKGRATGCAMDRATGSATRQYVQLFQMDFQPTAANKNWLSPGAEIAQKRHAMATSGPGVTQFRFKIVVQDGPKVRSK